MRTPASGALLVILATLLPGVGAAQMPAEWDAAREQMTRSELVSLLERLEEMAASTAYSAGIRSQVSGSVETVRRRLDEGDFQVGDRVVLEVEREPEMSDTLTVRAGQVVTIPVVGDISLRGVLRSELEEYLRAHLQGFVREPRVRARSLIRISILGEVSSPGFYMVPAETVVTDALMVAGGPTALANLQEMRIERGAQRIWEGQALEEAAVQGRTLDQLNIQAGDRIVVPLERQRDGWERFSTIAMTAGSLASVVFILTRAF